MYSGRAVDGKDGAHAGRHSKQTSREAKLNTGSVPKSSIRNESSEYQFQTLKT